MVFTLRPLEDADARAVAGWRYPEPYDVYDLPADPAAQALLADRERFGRELFASDLDGRLAALVRLERRRRVVTVGLALRPDLTGRGKGARLLADVVAFAGARLRPPSFRLLVAADNARARRAYARAGFRERRRLLLPRGDGVLVEFAEMERAAAG